MEEDSFSQNQLDDLFLEMIEFYQGDAKRIQHFTKVHSYARLIGKMEEMDPVSLFILEAAAYTHVIGIKPAEEKYGRCDEELQEKEGPILAQHMLSDLGFENYMIERICYLVGHLHSYDVIEDLDHQILVEADWLVNLYEKDKSDHRIRKVYNQIFKTESGKKICRQMFGLEEPGEEKIL